MAIKITSLSFLFILLLPQCKQASDTNNASKLTQSSIKFEDRKPSSDLDTIAIFTPATQSTFDLWKSLVGELGEEFNTSTLILDSTSSSKLIENHMKKTKPVAVVLLDNSTVKKYKNYQKFYKNDNTPVFIFMASFLKEIIGLIRNANGIAYEVPGVLSLVRARNILSTEVAKVGAVHRKAFKNYIKQEAAMLKKEKFELVGAAISDRPSTFELEAALDDLLNKHNVDALWILNDNSLLKQEFVSDVWLPTIHGSPMPVIVNVPVLLNPQIEFGTLAVTPDSSALGVQAANMIFNAYDADWEMDPGFVELPLSVLTYIDENSATSNFGMQKRASDFIDKRL